jgi:hypothetical protein
VFARRLAAGLLLGLGLAMAAPGAPPEPAARESPQERGKWKKRWIASWVALAASNVLDIHSSQGYREANPLMRDHRGQFAPGKAALIKGVITGGFLSCQLWTIRAHPEKDYYRPFTLANGVAAGALGGVAIRNYSLPDPAPVATVPAHLAPAP